MRVVAMVVALLAGWLGAAHATPGTTTDGPGALVVVIDRSLPADKLGAITDALGDALDGIDPGTQIAIVGAGKTATVLAGLSPAKAKAKLLAAAKSIRWTKSTNLLAGMRAAQSLLATAKKQSRHVLVITDGDALLGVEQLGAGMKKAGVVVSALGYQSLNRVTLTAIAGSGGGRLYLADDRVGVVQAFAEEAKPIPPKPQNRAFAFLIDRSGSMQGPKLEAAKEAVRAAIEILGPEDIVTVIAFDSESMMLVRPQRVANRMRISTEVARLTSGGGTNIFPALKEAFDVLEPISATKMAIVLSDGEAPMDGIAELVADMRAKRITVSAVGLPGADRNMLSLIADGGDGRLYMVDDIGSLPRVFLKEIGESR